MISLRKMALLYLILLCVLAAVSASAQETQGANDPYDPKSVFLEGPFKGEPIDTSVRRSIQILTPAEAASFNPGPGELVVANIYHEGQFWIGKIPADSVDKVFNSSWDFSQEPYFFHSELRFKFKPGKEVELFPQLSGQAPLDNNKLSDLIFSVEVIGRKGDSLNPEGGVSKHFVKAYRFKSLRENFFERVMLTRYVVTQNPVNFSHDDLQKLFKSSLQDSHDAGLHLTYHMKDDNCITVVFGLFDRIMGRTFFTDLKKSVTELKPLKEFLKEGGLLIDGAAGEYPTLNDEFATLKADRALKRRMLAVLQESKGDRDRARQERRNEKHTGEAQATPQCGPELSELG